MISINFFLHEERPVSAVSEFQSGVGEAWDGRHCPPPLRGESLLRGDLERDLGPDAVKERRQIQAVLRQVKISKRNLNFIHI